MEEMEFKNVLRNIWNNKLIILLIICISIIIGWCYSYIILEPIYQTSTTLLLEQKKVNDDSVSTYSSLIKTKDVLNQIIQNSGIKITQEELKSSISVKSISGTELIKITVENNNPENASILANEAANVFNEKIAKEIYNLENIHIVEIAEVNNEPSNINHKKDLIMAFFIGILLASAYIFIITILDTTIKSSEEVEAETELIVLGTIPEIATEEKGGKRYE